MRYGLAVVSVVMALGLALLLRSFDITITPHLVAVGVTVWYAGLGPGFLAIVLSLLSLDYFFIAPLHEVELGLVHLPEFLVFTILALIVSAVSASRRRAEAALRQARDELDTKVAERTAELKRSEAYLAEAQRLTHTGSFVRHVATGNATHSSDEHTRLFGFDPADGVPSQQAMLDRIHPDDIERFHETFADAIRRKSDFDITFRVCHPDGSLRYLNGIGHPVCDASGTVSEFIGTTMDVTERMLAEQERQAHLWFFESMDRVNRAIQGTRDPEQMMSHVLEAVLAIFECDRAWVVYPCDPDAPTWRVPMEHTRPEFPGAFAMNLSAAVDADVAAVFRAVLGSTGPVRFGAGEPHALPRQLANMSVQSQLALAIYPKVDRPYMFGLHQCSRARGWTPQEEQLFQQIGQRLADALTSLLMFRTLRDSEAKLEQAQRMAHVGYWHRDFETQRISWSDETYRIFGRRPEQGVVALDQLAELLHPDDRDRMRRAIADALGGGPRYDIEYRTVLPGGELRILHSQGDVVRDGAGRPLQMFGTVQDITERKLAEQALEDLAGRLINAQEEERRRIGRELHDHVSQTLTLVLLKIDQLHDDPATPPALAGPLMDLRDAAGEAMADVRRLSHRLHSSMLDYLGLVPALQKLAAEFAAHHNIAIELAHAAMPDTLPPDVALSLFRVTEESLTNVGKHSRARSARIELYGAADGIHLAVDDDGHGFNVTDRPGKGGLGFVSMQERLRLLRGTIRIESAPSRGTTVRAWVPATTLAGHVLVARPAPDAWTRETFPAPAR